KYKNVETHGGASQSTISQVVKTSRLNQNSSSESAEINSSQSNRISASKEQKTTEDTKYFRILADHSRAATFILADGVAPSNKDQGYILRRFIRRLVRYGLKLGIEQNFTKDLAISVIEKLKEP